MARRQIKANESRAQARRSDQGRSGQIARTRMHIATATGMRIATTEEQIRADQGRSRRPESRPNRSQQPLGRSEQIATTRKQIRAERNNPNAEQVRPEQIASKTPRGRSGQIEATRGTDQSLAISERRPGDGRAEFCPRRLAISERRSGHGRAEVGRRCLALTSASIMPPPRVCKYSTEKESEAIL